MNGCDHCGSHCGLAYTLTAHPEADADAGIELYFCSADCLQAWTGSPTATPGERAVAGTADHPPETGDRSEPRSQ